ncbi:MAG: S9 family peptidase [Gammaproteobacteria bacterium]|nr:S9 family peptidase [Gammaproteobacteria bacterium]
MLLAAVFLNSTQAAPPFPPTVQTFFSYAQISGVQISPDGSYIAILVADKTGEDRKGMAIMDLKDHSITASFKTIGDQVIYRYWWANKERVLIATATQTGSLDSPIPDGRLYGINVDASQLEMLLGNAPSPSQQFTRIRAQHETHYFWRMLYIPPEDAKQVIVESYTGPHQPEQAYSLNIYDGTLRNVAHSPAIDGELFVDNNGAVRMATGSNGLTGVPQFFYRESGDSLDWKDLSSLMVKGDSADSELTPLGFTADNKDIYWIGHTPSPSLTLGLYTLDPETLKTTLLFGDPDFDVNNMIWSLEWQKSRHIIAVTTMPGLPALHILDSDAPESGYLASLYDAFPGQVVDVTSNTRDGSQLVIFVHSDRNPGSYYLFNTKDNKVALLFNLLPDIDPQKMANMRPVVFKARDGVALHGYLTLPLGSNGKNLPLIINPHGGPHGIRDEWGWDPEVQFFASHGYAVLQVNYRGSGGYGMQFQDMGYRHWGTSMQDDLADAVHWAVGQGVADPKRICIYGASYGGYAAVENVIRYPDLYKCAVGYVGVYDLTLLAHHGDIHHFASGQRYLDIALGDDDAELEKYSPAYNADKIKTPLFIVYGGADMRVVPENAKELMSALDKASIKYEMMYEPNEGHGFAKPEHRFELYTRMLQFFDKYIGPDAVKH